MTLVAFFILLILGISSLDFNLNFYCARSCTDPNFPNVSKSLTNVALDACLVFTHPCETFISLPSKVSQNPDGSLTFRLFFLTDTTCSGNAIFQSSVGCGECTSSLPSSDGGNNFCIQGFCFKPLFLFFCGGSACAGTSCTPPPTSAPTGNSAPLTVPTLPPSSNPCPDCDTMTDIVAEMNQSSNPLFASCIRQTSYDVLCNVCPLIFAPDVPGCIFNRYIVKIELVKILSPHPWQLPPSIARLRELVSIVVLDEGYIPGLGSSQSMSVQVYGTIPEAYYRMPLLTQLVVSGLPKISGTLPDFSKWNTTFPRLFTLSHNALNLDGTLPSRIGSVFPGLKTLYVFKTRLSGTVPEDIFSPSLYELDLSDNNLSGTIPTTITTLYPAGIMLSLINNNMTGTIPVLPVKIRSLFLGFNRFTGTVPDDWGFKSSSPTPRIWDFLSFPDNLLTGTLPSQMYVQRYFSCQNNNLQGIIPPFMGGLYQMVFSQNNFSDFSSTFYPLPSLQIVQASSNSLQKFPYAFISESSFYPLLTTVSVQNNTISGNFTPGLTILETLTTLDVSSNILSGTIEFVINCSDYLSSGTGNKSNCKSNFEDKRTPYNFNFAINRLAKKSFGAVFLAGYSSEFRGGLATVNVTDSRYISNYASATYVVLGEQDTNECEDGTHLCQQQCLEGWFPVFSYTCGCSHGYKVSDLDFRQCIRVLLPHEIAVIVLVIFIAIGLLVTSGFLFFYFRDPLHILPPQINWSFLNQWTHPWRWEFYGKRSSGYYIQEYTPDSPEWRKVEDLRSHVLVGRNLVPREIYAVYNPTLTQSFINNWKITHTRRRNDLASFGQNPFHKKPEKRVVLDAWERLRDALEWNAMEVDKRSTFFNGQSEFASDRDSNPFFLTPIMVGAHGTDYDIAEKIAQTGFASLSSLDAGYFGKGIYFTTILHYTLPYSCIKRKPSCIISYINMGNIYPVVESHKGPNSLLGTALKSGFNSHFVLTDQEGNVYEPNKNKDTVVCNEIVVGQESQILPAFILTFDTDLAKREFVNWERSIPTANDEMTLLKESPSSPVPLHSEIEISISSNAEVYLSRESLGLFGHGLDEEEDERYFLLQEGRGGL